MLKKAFLYSTVLAPIIAGLFIGIHVFIILNQSYHGPDKEFVIDSGESFSRINYNLYKEGIISNPRIFHYYARFKGQMENLKSGTYLFKSGVTIPEVLNILHSGLSQLLTVTIPEGKNIYEISGILVENKVLSTKQEFIDEVHKKIWIQKLSPQAKSLEGYLFPETYKFSPNTSAKKVVEVMLRGFNQKTKDINFQSPLLKNRHEIITLASIVEKETGAKWERKKIAGVFLNRLKKKMRLQSDPTTIYGLFPNFDGNLRKKDLLEKTPYNTYAIAGLPQGPICNPGLEAIKAVLEPDNHEFLYFVSQNDGTHVFSKSYKDHSKAVDYWQKTKANREGRSWRDLKQ
ncbi:MAG: endolytic transglycosylase MltG [Halobacteriovoraceae bacterium]|nr:endolytic transglycosylase MltG [Halobacteriovoraceae bacterium]MCB9095636.1 endolytic transglycosylase MltG [Halobacteriovoraceae bacterium]